MNLEDHLGDIIRKARSAAGVSAGKAALALRVSPAELAELEQTGETSAHPDLRALALAVGLHPGKLEGIARGWRPPAYRLARWRELRQISTTRGGNTVNCFLAWDPATREAVLFDTGWDAAPVQSLIDENRLGLKHLFITHSHDDHVAALEPLQELFPTMTAHGAPGPGSQAQREWRCGGLRIASRLVPGHATDGVAWIVSHWPGNAPSTACVGDTIFAGSLAKGFISADQLKESVQKEILSLPPDTLLCPGHGPVTTVAEERAHNPFVMD
jgi:hydroxyacylglutathione hydrolase